MKFFRPFPAAKFSRLLLIALFVLLTGNLVARAQTYAVIHNFAGGLDGAEPSAGLTIDAAGNLYGPTFEGDAGTGTIYKIAHHSGGWLLSPLYLFPGGSDGAVPYARVTFGPSGALYGTTGFGGEGPCQTYYHTGCGTVFSLQPLPHPPATPLTPWNERVLYRFSGSSDGATPYSGDIIFDSTGNIYGTAYSGGSLNCGGGCGVVYKLTPSGGSWTETVLYTFTGADGTHPWAGVTMDRSGNLFGTTVSGGAYNAGTVFELSPSGSGYVQRVLYSFTGGSDGGNPYAGLIFDSAGNLYGASASNGAGSGGTVFELTPSGGGWNFTTLYGFNGASGQFAPGPVANLIFDSAGSLYGTTHSDGAYHYGTVFKLTHGSGGWSYTSFHDFTGGADGGYPRSNIVFDSHGNMYGTAAYGGTGNCGQPSCGVIFEVTP